MNFAKAVSRRLFVALAGTALAATLAAGPALAEGKTYALIQINQQALFFNDMNRGAEAAVAETGDTLQIFNANNDPAAQNSAIETYIQEGVDGLIVVAIDVNGIMPAVQQAADAGIPVVAIDAILPDGPHLAQIGVDNEKAGADLGKYVAASGGAAKVGVVGALNSFIQNVRLKGFEDVAKAAPGVTFASTVDGQNVQDIAMAAAENLMTPTTSTWSQSERSWKTISIARARASAGLAKRTASPSIVIVPSSGM